MAVAKTKKKETLMMMKISGGLMARRQRMRRGREKEWGNKSCEITLFNRSYPFVLSGGPVGGSKESPVSDCN